MLGIAWCQIIQSLQCEPLDTSQPQICLICYGLEGILHALTTDFQLAIMFSSPNSLATITHLFIVTTIKSRQLAKTSAGQHKSNWQSLQYSGAFRSQMGWIWYLFQLRYWYSLSGTHEYFLRELQMTAGSRSPMNWCITLSSLGLHCHHRSRNCLSLNQLNQQWSTHLECR